MTMMIEEAGFLQRRLERIADIKRTAVERIEGENALPAEAMLSTGPE